MPSPGISFGDLAVFIAVLVIVAVFLDGRPLLHQTRRNTGRIRRTAAAKPQETRAEKSSMPASQKITPSI